MDRENIQHLAACLKKSTKLLVFTGAGEASLRMEGDVTEILPPAVALALA